jgi:hypothetical protein
MGISNRLHLNRYCAVMLGFISASSCSNGTEPRAGDAPTPTIIAAPYVLGASASITTDASPRLQFSLLVTNKSQGAFDINYGGCWAFVQLFASADLTKTPIFDSGALGAACTLESSRVTIGPNQTGSLVGQYPVATILDLGVARGHYFVALRVAPNDSARQIFAGQIDLQP